MKRYLQEPLIYFVLIGSLLFIAFDFFGQTFEDDKQTITVERMSLLNFMQRKTKIIDQTRLIKAFDDLTTQNRQKLIEAYVREEALYRESKALSLDKNDPIIKARAIQNLEFITQEYSEAVIKVTDEQLETYFAEHLDNYYIEPFVTFTHVYFDQEMHGDEIAKELAAEKLIELNKNKVAFSEGVTHGNRFPFHVNYVERTPDFIASHFGESMAKEVFSIPVANETIESQQWHGPFKSNYGYHLVMVSKRAEGRHPELTEVIAQVHQDTQRDQIRNNLEKTYQSIIDTYHVELSEDLSINRAAK